jgi:UDP-glucuronate decarboxylase
MRILVTGAAGFIGSHVVDRLLYDGHQIDAIDNLISGDIKNLEHLRSNSNFDFHIGDVREYLDFRPGVVFNFACPASPASYQKDPIDTLTTSVIGAQRLIELAKRTKCTVVHASTSEVYGDPEVHPQPETYWGNVNPVGPRSCYDEGKRAAETLLTDAKRTFKLDTRIIRIFNTYGPRMQPDDGRVVSSFIVQALKQEPLTVYGNGQQTRSFCYVDDLLDGILKIAFHPTSFGPVNLGNPEEISIQTLANKIVELTDSQSIVAYQQLPEDDPKCRKPDISKAIKSVGFRPKVSLEEGLKHTISYFRKRLA